jgi:hypothetical protein
MRKRDREMIRSIATRDKPTAHSVALATNRQLFWHVTRGFSAMPTPIAM